MTVSTREIDEILVISVTDRMTRRGGIDALSTALAKGVQREGGRILLDLEPTDWDSYGFGLLALALQCIAENQKKVVCRIGQIPIRDFRWIKVLFSRADCFDTLDEALAALREDC